MLYVPKPIKAFDVTTWLAETLERGYTQHDETLGSARRKAEREKSSLLAPFCDCHVISVRCSTGRLTPSRPIAWICILRCSCLDGQKWDCEMAPRFFSPCLASPRRVSPQSLLPKDQSYSKCFLFTIESRACVDYCILFGSRVVRSAP